MFTRCLYVLVCVHSDFIEPSPSLALRSFSDAQTRLPCRFRVEANEYLVQVTWSRQKPGGEREQIIIGHYTQGPTVSPDFLSRVQFESSDPTVDSTLLILNTKKADQATYTCHISIFPSGSFQRQISLTVWSRPISSLDPVILEEGQSFRAAAFCRAVGDPPPRLSWDTELPGRSQNRTGEDGVVTSQFSLHPLRSMNKRRLDCLVWHPALDGPHRISNELQVHYPPHAVIADSGSWIIGHSGSELRCVVKGNPLPQNITWSRKHGRLPVGVLVQEDRLLFVRPLNVTDEGVYICQTANSVGIAKAEFKVEIRSVCVLEPWFGFTHVPGSPSETLLIIIGASVAGVLLVILVITIIFLNCHLRRKNRKLKRTLSTRMEEMVSLSRQVSMRKINSVNGDLRTAPEESSLIQMDSVTKGSVFSVEDCSTLSDVKGRYGDGEYDSLGRPAIYTAFRPERSSKNTREMEEERNERRLRVEYYVKSSNISLDSGLHRDQSPPPPSVSSGPTADVIADGWKIHRAEREKYVQRERVPEGEEESCEVNYHLSEATNNYFQCSNGGLTPKPNSNAIIIHSRGQII